MWDTAKLRCYDEMCERVEEQILRIRQLERQVDHQSVVIGNQKATIEEYIHNERAIENALAPVFGRYGGEGEEEQDYPAMIKKIVHDLVEGKKVPDMHGSLRCECCEPMGGYDQLTWLSDGIYFDKSALMGEVIVGVDL